MAPNLLALNAARVLAAAGAGVFTPVAAAVAVALSPPEARARTLAAVFFGLTLAQVFGVPLGSYLAYAFGWRWAFWTVVLIGLPCIWLIWRTVPAGLRFQPVSLGDLGRVLCTPRLMAAVLFTTSFLSGIYIVFTYLSPLLESRMGFGATGITSALLMAGLGAVAGNLLGGVLTDRFGPVRTLFLLCAAQVCLLTSFSVLPLPVPLIFAQIFLWNLFGWSFMAAQQTRLIGLEPQGAQVLLSLNAAAIYVGAALGSALGGAVIAGIGIGALGAAGAVVALCAALHLAVSVFLARRG
jgi:predicted MFS family arabinose efflux permease